MSGYDSALIGLEISEHPVLLALPRGIRLLALEAWIWSCARHTDGMIPAAALPRLTDEPDPEKAAAELVRVHQWEMTAEGWRIVGFLDHQDSAEDVRKKREQQREYSKRYRDKVAARAAGEDSRRPSRKDSRQAARTTDRTTDRREEGSKEEWLGGDRAGDGASPPPPLTGFRYWCGHDYLHLEEVCPPGHMGLRLLPEPGAPKVAAA
jgi:hypothetical protein